MTDALAGVGVLVTRPRARAVGLCRALAARGARVVAVPMIEIEPLALPPGGAESLAAADRLVFVSPNAAERALSLVAAHGVRLTGRVGAVGHGTAAALGRGGLAVTDIPDSSSGAQALLDTEGMQRVTGERVVVLRGEDGGGLLGEVLRARGAEVTELALYRRVRPNADLRPACSGWRAGWLRVTIVTSATGLEHLVALAGSDRAHLLETRLVAVSGRVAELGRRAGFRAPVTVADDPGDSGLVQAAVRAATTDKEQA